MSRQAYLGLALLFCLTWSSAFPAAKLAIATAPPLIFLGVRFLIAAALLLGYAGWRGDLRGVPWRKLMAMGLLNQAGYQGLAWLAMGTVSAGLATIVTSLNPILIGVAAVPVLGERMTGRKAVGLLLGFLGAAFVVRNRIVLTGEDPVGIGLLFLGMISLTLGTLWFKRSAPALPLAVLVGAQQAGSGLALLAIGLATEPVGAVHPGAQFWLVMAWFVLVVSVGSFLLWFLLLRQGSASAAASLHFLMPPLGLLMSWAVLGEPLQALDLLGVVPVALGIRLATAGGRS
jgi:drug/metabolite transporter (DMT)-like permease